MKVNGNSLRIGNVINLKEKLWIVTKAQAVRTGKGGAFAQIELKGITDTTKRNERFRSDEQVERVFLSEKDCQFIYSSDDEYFFMDNETFDQFSLKEEFIGDQVKFLKDGMNVRVSFHETSPISISLPEHVVLEITETEPAIKGQSASSSYKPAVLENGVRITVPPHIEIGMKVVVNTAEFSYVERAKS